MRITGEHLMAAAEGHVERCAVAGTEELELLLESEGVDSTEFRSLIGVLRDIRSEHMPEVDWSAYAAGAIDGAVLILRASAAARSTGV